jgi:hypothetical protein
MAETQGIEKVLEKLAQILTAKGSCEVLDILEELEKSSQLNKDRSRKSQTKWENNKSWQFRQSSSKHQMKFLVQTGY